MREPRARAAASASSGGGSCPRRSCLPARSWRRPSPTAWADPAFRSRLDGLLRALRRSPDAGHRVRAAERAARHPAALEARGPGPHRVAQAQQRHRPGAPGRAHGQAAAHRRDRRRPARRRHRDRRGPARARVRRLHGCGRRRAPGPERLPHGAARRRGASGPLGQPDAEGRHQRGPARLGGDRRDDALLHRFGHGAAPLPVHRPRVPARRRRRGPRAVPGAARRLRSRRRRGLRRRRLERGRHLRRLRRHRRPARRRRGRRGRRHEQRRPRAWCTGCGRGSCRTRPARSSRRARSPPGSTTPASVPSTPTSERSAGPSTSRRTTPRCSRPSACWRRPKASSPPWNPPTRSPGSSERPGESIPEGSAVLDDAVGPGRQGRGAGPGAHARRDLPEDPTGDHRRPRASTQGSPGRRSASCSSRT